MGERHSDGCTSTEEEKVGQVKQQQSLLLEFPATTEIDKKFREMFKEHEIAMLEVYATEKGHDGNCGLLVKRKCCDKDRQGRQQNTAERGWRGNNNNNGFSQVTHLYNDHAADQVRKKMCPHERDNIRTQKEKRRTRSYREPWKKKCYARKKRR